MKQKLLLIFILFASAFYLITISSTFSALVCETCTRDVTSPCTETYSCDEPYSFTCWKEVTSPCQKTYTEPCDEPYSFTCWKPITYDCNCEDVCVDEFYGYCFTWEKQCDTCSDTVADTCYGTTRTTCTYSYTGTCTDYVADTCYGTTKGTCTRDATCTETEYYDCNCVEDTPACTPSTCSYTDCGSIDDGCGGTLNCGTCPEPEPVCTTITCGTVTCGSIGDGCGGTINCGTCATGQTCTNGKCETTCTLSDSDGLGYQETCKDAVGTYKDYCSGQDKYLYSCSNNRCKSTLGTSCTSSETCTISSTGNPTCVAKPNNAPTTPSSPSGASSGVVGISYSYSTSATDPDGDNVKYVFDWGDGTTYTTGLVASGSSLSASHSWSTAGAYNVKAKTLDSKDSASGWSSSQSVSISPWSISLSASSSSTAPGTSVDITATTNADIGSSVYYTRIYDGTTQIKSCSTGTTCTASVKSDTATSKTYAAKLENYAATDVQVTSNSVTVKWVSPDKTQPTTTISCNNVACSASSYKSGVSISLSCADNTGGSGCEKIEYCVDTANTCTPSTSYVTSFSVSAGGTTYVRYRSTDKAGNIETIKSTAVKVDSASPTVGTISPNRVTTATQTFSASASDNIGVASCNFFVDGVDKGAMSLSASPCLSCSASIPYSFYVDFGPNAPGNYNAHAECTDVAGNKALGSDVVVTVIPSSSVNRWGYSLSSTVQCTYIGTSDCLDTDCNINTKTVKANACEVEYSLSGVEDGRSSYDQICNCPAPGADPASCAQPPQVFTDHDYAAVEKCPNAPLSDGGTPSSLNERKCVVYKDGVTYPNTWEPQAKWDASESKCISCNGLLQNKIYGDTSGLYGDTVSSTQCESACGSLASVDDRSTPVVDSLTIDGKPCTPNMPIKKGNSFTLGYTVVGGTNSADREVTSANMCTGSSCFPTSDNRIGCNTGLDAGACSSKSDSFKFTAPTLYGTYTYSVSTRNVAEVSASSSRNCDSSPTDTKSCTIIAADCFSNPDCPKLTSGLKSSCDSPSGTPKTIEGPYSYSCYAPTACNVPEQCDPGFCCTKVSNPGPALTPGECKEIKYTSNPYLCK